MVVELRLPSVVMFSLERHWTGKLSKTICLEFTSFGGGVVFLKQNRSKCYGAFEQTNCFTAQKKGLRDQK